MRFGVDEAGKGPVLGSMFAACVAADPADLPDGVADSKTLTPARREELDAHIRDVGRVGVAEISSERIDAPDTDMNSLTVAAHARAIAAAFEDASLDDPPAGLCDAGDVDEDRFARRVASRVSFTITLTARHRADEDDALVAAASVVAKVARDAHVDALAARYGDVGSGYPSDPTTRAFLAEHVERHGDLPDCARRSWSTCDDVLAAAEQSSLDAF
ncbi:ribonuclease HII [Halocalculus aciditolerans]|uniref:Ribonuclease HII n=2 Tax=Halocalculus aciditolerans TaxID=1383812 RepID=A0A830FFC7_9EURY|nr:ribonuclease HII [Halocalculus aciditolerans]